jgi:hypothetical protein
MNGSPPLSPDPFECARRVTPRQWLGAGPSTSISFSTRMRLGAAVPTAEMAAVSGEAAESAFVLRRCAFSSALVRATAHFRPPRSAKPSRRYDDRRTSSTGVVKLWTFVVRSERGCPRRLAFRLGRPSAHPPEPIRRVADRGASRLCLPLGPTISDLGVHDSCSTLGLDVNDQGHQAGSCPSSVQQIGRCLRAFFSYMSLGLSAMPSSSHRSPAW